MSSSISGQNPEIIRQADDQQTSVNTSTPVQKENNAGIFRVGLTAEQARNEGLNSLFTQYNGDGDDNISQTEFDAYTRDIANQEQQDITSKSGKRIAVGGVYTIQKGDSLYAIANDFSMSVNDLYNANADVIGKSIHSTIYAGQQLKITKAQNNQPKTSTERKPLTEAERAERRAAREAQKQEKLAQTLTMFGLDLNDKDTQALLEQIKNLPEDKKDAVIHKLMGQYIDLDKAEKFFADKTIDEVATKIGIDKDTWDNASSREKSKLLANKMNEKYRNELDETNPESGYNKAFKRFMSGGATEKERELFGAKFDFDNLSKEDCKNLAKIAVAQTYAATIITIAHKHYANGEDDKFAISSNAFMRSVFREETGFGNDLDNMLAFMSELRQIKNDDIKSVLETYAEVHVSDGSEDQLLQSLAFHAVLENVDEEHIKMLYQNNAEQIDILNEIAKTVANNTTDETRKAMLNNIVENSASIAQGNTASSTSQSSNGQGSSTNINNVSGMTNPIQNSTQINYINNLKEASANFHNQSVEDNNDIPQEFQKHFKTVKEYLSFKGTGMTMAEYQKMKNLKRQDFTSAMNDLIKNYELIEDKHKFLAYFDAMDDNTRCELYIDGTNEVRHFMKRFNYLKNDKLLRYAQLHPAEINKAPKEVQIMVKELLEEDAIKQS